MDLNFILYIVYLLALVLCVVAGAIERRRMDGAMRIFFVLIIVIVASEAGAFLAERYTGTNTELYNAADIVQSALIFWYFSASLGRRALGAILVTFTLAFGLYNFFFVQQQALINNYFLLWNGAAVIGLCLYQMVVLAQKRNSIKLQRNAHFLIAAALLFYWTMNMLNFQVFNLYAAGHVSYAVALNVAHQFSNIVTYLTFAGIFLYLSKLIQ